MSGRQPRDLRPRGIPVKGGRVVAAYLAVQIPGTIVEVSADGRELWVALTDGERVRFQLSRATGTFVASDTSGARLLFE